MMNNTVLQHYTYQEILELIENTTTKLYDHMSKTIVGRMDDTHKKYDGADFCAGTFDIADQQIMGFHYILKSATNARHTVSICRDKNGFFFHCGSLPFSPDKDLTCNFFSNPLRINGYNLCKHILLILFHKSNSEEMSKVLIPELESDWQRKYGDNAQIPTINIDELAYLKRFAFKANILIEGDRGSGKTYDVHKLADELNIDPVTLGGHAGIESIDMLGHLTPYCAPACIEKVSVSASDLLSGARLNTVPQQQLVWKDGALTEAFRKAANGQKTILILDELLRIPQRELNILLTALSPINGKYVLRTGRIISLENGVANEEVIKAPVENLFVTATTNVGGQYSVDDIDPALAERFIIIRKDTTVGQLKAILKKYADEKEFPETAVLQLVEFFKKTTEAKRQGIIENVPTARTLSRAFQLADSETDIWDRVKDHVLLWIGRDTEGFPIKEQHDVIIRIIETVKKMK